MDANASNVRSSTGSEIGPLPNLGLGVPQQVTNRSAVTGRCRLRWLAREGHHDRDWQHVPHGRIHLHELLADKGQIQLPDFQRGWVWNDGHIRALIASVSLSYPIGAVMLSPRQRNGHAWCRRQWSRPIHSSSVITNPDRLEYSSGEHYISRHADAC